MYQPLLKKQVTCIESNDQCPKCWLFCYVDGKRPSFQLREQMPSLFCDAVHGFSCSEEVVALRCPEKWIRKSNRVDALKEEYRRDLCDMGMTKMTMFFNLFNLGPHDRNF